MKIWEPKSFLICFDAKNGSLILGTVRLIGALLNIVYCASGALTLQVQIAGLNNLPSCIRQPNGDMCKDQLQTTAVLLNAAVISVYSIQCLVCIMLIHGIRKRKTVLMIPYMAYIASSITFYILGSGFGLYVYCPELYSALEFVGVITVIVLIETYFLLVVRSHYHEIRRSGDENGNYKKLQEC